MFWEVVEKSIDKKNKVKKNHKMRPPWTPFTWHGHERKDGIFSKT